jgi:hypothetical protein
MANSKLTPAQWIEVDTRLQAGERPQDICGDYGVTEGAIRHHFGPIKKDRVERAAVKIVEARQAKQELPPILQIKAESLADRLEALSKVMAQSAEVSSKTALRLAELANVQAQKIDDTDPDAEMVRAVHALTDTSNKAAYQGLELLKSNKGATMMKEDETPLETIDPEMLSMQAMEEIMAAKDRALAR